MTDRKLSDAPFTVDGITIRPKVPISADQRAHTARQVRAMGRPTRTPEAQAEAYRLWKETGQEAPLAWDEEGLVCPIEMGADAG